MNTAKLSFYQTIFFATLWYATPVRAMSVDADKQQIADHQYKIKCLQDKMINERLLRHNALNNNKAEVQRLLQIPHVSINAISLSTGNTALHLAVENGHKEIVDILLQNKAAVNCYNFSIATPLHLATEMGHLAVGKALLENKANVDVLNGTKSTPLHIAIANDDGAYVNLLLAHNADTTVKNSYGNISYPDVFIYSEERGHTPPSWAKTKQLDAKNHSIALCDRLIPIAEEQKAMRKDINKLNSELLYERLEYLSSFAKASEDTAKNESKLT